MFGSQTPEYSGRLRWPRLAQDAAIVLWPSFIAASVATMISFALVDPLLIGPDDSPPPGFTTRMSGYAVGFFFYWLISALASLLTLYLLRTAHPDARDQDQPDDGHRDER